MDVHLISDTAAAAMDAEGEIEDTNEEGKTTTSEATETTTTTTSVSLSDYLMTLDWTPGGQ